MSKEDLAIVEPEEAESSTCVNGTRRVSMRVNLLRNPSVTHVSLVPNGANQTPLKIVKSAEVGITQNQPPEPMKKNTQGAPVKKGDTPVVNLDTPKVQFNRITFAKDQFKSEAEVRLYMEQGGFTYGAINDTEKAFEIAGVHDSALESVHECQGDLPGVTFFIGVPKAAADEPAASAEQENPAEPATPTEPVSTEKDGGSGDDETEAPETTETPEVSAHTGPSSAVGKVPNYRGRKVGGNTAQAKVPVTAPKKTKTSLPTIRERAEVAAEPMEEVVQKIDTYIARQVKSISLSATMNAGNDRELPGCYDVFSAIRVTLENIIQHAATSEIPGLIDALMTDGGQVLKRLTAVFISDTKADRTGAMTTLFANPEDDDDDTTGEDAGEAVAKSDETPANLTAVLGLLQEMNGKFDELQKSATVTSTRLAALEVIRQTKKALPVEGGASNIAKSDDGKEESIKKAAEKRKADDLDTSRRLSRNLLGIGG